jgi:uncharacterized protein YceH (UPF0502 family)
METEAPMIEPQFSPKEARVLACLMEKALTTPDGYPLTVNSLTLACNQKNNREPLMNLGLGEVGHLVTELSERQLLRVDYGGRANRISHCMDTAFSLNRKQQAVLAVLMLRDPQTLNEVRIRTERMADFAGAEETLGILENLMGREPPLAVCLPKGAGQREDRYAHTLCGMSPPETPQPRPAPSSRTTADTDRLAALEQRVEALEHRLTALLERIGAD